MGLRRSVPREGNCRLESGVSSDFFGAVYFSVALIFFAVGYDLYGADLIDGAAPVPVSFRKDIAPILVKKCISCHGADKAKGGYNVSSFAMTMEPGDSEANPIVAGEPEQSELFLRLKAADEDDRMPQKDDSLPAGQIELFERWIKEGGRFDGESSDALLTSLIPRDAHPKPPKSYAFPMPVAALAFSPDGSELAVGGYHEITIWDPQKGVLMRRITNVAQRVYSLSYHSKANLIASAGGAPGLAGEVSLYRADDGVLEAVLGTMPDVALALCFNRDGSLLASGGADSVIRFYDVASGEELSSIQQHADWVTGIAFSPDGEHLASASRDRSARVYDVEDGELLSTYTGHGGAVFEIGFSEDGSEVLSSGRDNRVHVWSTKDGKRARTITGFDGNVTRLLAVENQVFVCTTENRIRQYSITDRKLRSTYEGHQDWIYGLAVDSANQRLATGSHDGEVRVWDTVNGSLVVAFIAAPGYEEEN